MLSQYIHWLAKYIHSHIQEICFGITAVTLMVAGPSINGLLKHITRSMHWFFRYVFFVILCTAGYGFLSQVIYHGLKSWLRGQSGLMLVIWTCAIYLILAWFAKRFKDI
ncbi:MAG TPA: DUF3392 family protein [Chitinispirillaceae bacterium]|nr:DUF3392 family protein [Chitinispirillaceae bacterium]